MPSTAIRSMRYNEGSRTLTVWFVPSGHRYDYFDVPPEVYVAFRSSGVKGRFFNTRIRDRYEYRQVPEPVS
ncbi:MAG TPA: KTSC domain-containing protein [Candidatus Limnocylindria bacterium]|nr:KTSC domain-containing protein [Candidatus Limnocylindria bacterium]